MILHLEYFAQFR